MTQLTYEDFQQRGQAVIDAAMPLREEAIQLEKQVAAEHLAATFARDAQMKAHWAIRDAQDAKHMASAKFLLTAESRLAAAEATLDKAREAIGLADGADAITESTPDIPEKYVRAFISERAIMFDEADAPIAAYLTRTEKPFLYDAWAEHIRQHWIEGDPGSYRRPNEGEATCTSK